MKRTEATQSLPRHKREDATVLDLFGPKEERYAKPSEFTRDDCRGHEGPCPMASCAYHLLLDADPETGAIRFNHGDPQLHAADHDGSYLESVLRGMRFTCALDVADAVADGERLEWSEIAELIGAQPDWAFQYMQAALAKMKANEQDRERLSRLRVPPEARRKPR